MNFIPSKETLKAAFLKYLPLGAAVFFIGLVWNFPYEKAVGKFTEKIALRTGYQITTDSLSLALPIGLKGENVRITQPMQNLNVQLDQLRLTVSPFFPLTYLFAKSFSISFSAKQDQTNWKGSVHYGKEDSGFELTNKNWRLDHSFPLDTLSPMLTGSLLKLATLANISVDLNGKTQALQLNDFSQASGEMNISTTQTNVEAPFLNQIRFDKISMSGKMEKGKLNFKSINLAGPDLNGTITGSVTVANIPSNSILDIDARLTASAKLKETLLTLLPMLQNSGIDIRMNEDGTIALKVSGPVNYPSMHSY